MAPKRISPEDAPPEQRVDQAWRSARPLRLGFQVEYDAADKLLLRIWTPKMTLLIEAWEGGTVVRAGCEARTIHETATRRERPTRRRIVKIP